MITLGNIALALIFYKANQCLITQTKVMHVYTWNRFLRIVQTPVVPVESRSKSKRLFDAL